MNARLLASGLLLALALCAAGIWIDRSTVDAAGPGAAAQAGQADAPAPTAQPASTAVAVQRSQVIADATRAAERPEQAVNPLLELNALLTSSALEDNTTSLQSAIDELLGARYASHTGAERETSLRALRSVLTAQRTGSGLAPDDQLDEASLRALELEAAWLKEHLQP